MGGSNVSNAESTWVGGWVGGGGEVCASSVLGGLAAMPQMVHGGQWCITHQQAEPHTRTHLCGVAACADVVALGSRQLAPRFAQCLAGGSLWPLLVQVDAKGGTSR